MSERLKPLRGRGASDNPTNRFEENYLDYDLDPESGEKPKPNTQLFSDDTKSIISWNKSPDVPFNAGLNPYRGCEHGCIYCYARPFHEYLGFSVGLDFESKIMVKHNASELLRKQLRSPKWDPQVIAMSGVTDCYQPIERKLRITRDCLKVLAEFRNPVSIITKNHLVTRDIDLLKELNKYHAVQVTLSITSLDSKLIEVMEPRTSRPRRRLAAIEELANAGIPVGVNVAPIIPGLTDHECADILRAAANAGATRATYIMLRLPYQVKDLFFDWLAQHFPERIGKIQNRLVDQRGEDLYESKWGERMKGKGKYAKQIKDLFELQCKQHGLNKSPHGLSSEHFKRLSGQQLHLF